MEDAEKWSQHFSLLKARRSFEGFEFKWVRPDEKVRMLRLSGQPMFDKEGRFQGYRGVGQDVTEYKRLEEQSKQRWTELARFSRVVLASEMATTLLHELNQPLGAVINYCAAVQRMLHAGAEHSPLFAEAVAQAALQARRATEITHRVRNFFNIGNSQRTQIHLNDLIEEVVALVDWETREKHCVVETQLHPFLPPVYADRLQIEQVVLNLMHNGMDAMEQMEEPEKRLIIRTAIGKEDERSVEVTIEDVGPGIDPAVLERMFDAFYTTKAGGLGLGLSISRSIVEEHGGRLWAQYGPGTGTHLHFILPTE
jgi:C4-dicarboxylate-specific signal transduction histidine kinase